MHIAIIDYYCLEIFLRVKAFTINPLPILSPGHVARTTRGSFLIGLKAGSIHLKAKASVYKMKMVL
jgi:hypothetical protein